MDISIIQQKIYEIRGEKVMPDFDLARLYGVETKALNHAIKRNVERFPPDFMFQLTPSEWSGLRSQIVTSNRGGRRYLPNAFTEHGVTMLASVLKSDTTVKIPARLTPVGRECSYYTGIHRVATNGSPV